jgi:hypothetical protein
VGFWPASPETPENTGFFVSICGQIAILKVGKTRANGQKMTKFCIKTLKIQLKN